MSAEKKMDMLKQGDELTGFTREVTLDRIAKYAEASGDHNPLHLDADYASTTQFGGVIAHGMLSMAFIGELMEANFPETWHRGGKMKLRFKAPVYPGETVKVSGEVRSVREVDGTTEAQCSVTCTKPDGTEALGGSITVPLA